MSSAKETRCRTCGAPIWYLQQAEPDRWDEAEGRTIPGAIKSTKFNPVEVATAEKGNISVDPERGTYTIVPKEQRGPGLHLSHFARCEQSREHRRT